MAAARIRLFIARRPWVYWIVVAALAASVAATTYDRLGAADEARGRWSDLRMVVVSTRDHRAGDELETRFAELPPTAVPADALDRVEPGARAGQRIGAGEVVVEHDVVPPHGPAAGAEPGTVVVPVVDPTARGARIGLPVRVVAEGIVLAEEGTIVEIVDDVVFVSMAPGDAAPVAAATKRSTASLLFLP